MPDSIITTIIYLFAAFGAFSLLKLIAGSIGKSADEEKVSTAAPAGAPVGAAAPVQYDSDELAAVAAAAISAFEEETCCNPLVRNAFD